MYFRSNPVSRRTATDRSTRMISTLSRNLDQVVRDYERDFKNEITSVYDIESRKIAISQDSRLRLHPLITKQTTLDRYLSILFNLLIAY